MGPDRNDRHTIASVAKAAKVLDCFNRNRPALSAAEIAQATGFSRASTYRLLATLEELGWLRKTTGGDYRLGLKLVRLGAMATTSFDFRRELRPVLEELSRQIGDGSYLLVPMEGRALCVDRVVGDQPVKLTMIEVGQALPPTLGGASLVMLAFGHPIPDSVNLDVDELDLLRRRLDHIREVGYATNFQEMVEGVSAISAPVLDETGTAVAAISVGGLSVRFNEERLPMIVTHLKRACDEARQRWLHQQVGLAARESEFG